MEVVMASELNAQQRREKAIQHAIASTFTKDAGERIDILIAALSRVVRSRTGGPVADRTASDYTQRLRAALTSENII
jgi:hypothetical protein